MTTMRLQNLDLRWVRVALAGLGISLAHSLFAQSVVLHLKSGDRVTGVLVSTNDSRIVVSNSWAKELSVPVAEILRREIVPLTNAPSAAPVVAAPKPAPPTTNAPVAKTPPAPPPAPPPAMVAATPPKPVKPKVKHWRGNAQVGLDLSYGARDRQVYYGLLKLTYERPYESNPKKFFRDIFEIRMDYGETEAVVKGKTDSVVSANKLDASNKTDFDVGKKLFVYNLVRGGYDEIRKLDMYYEAGPGAGYHLITATNFVMNTEAGMNYQAQFRNGSADTSNFYFRLAEDFTWKINKTMTLTEKFEFFPQVDFSNYRARFESTLAFPFWQRLTFNLTVLDLYDSNPGRSVNNNELQIRSSLGITF